MTKLNIERKSRIILGVLALVAILVFFLTTFQISQAASIGTIITGILLSLLIYAETGIVSWVKRSGWKKFTFGDIVVILGTISATALAVFSISLIPAVENILPASIISFTTTFARIIAGVALAVVVLFIVTPKFE